MGQSVSWSPDDQQLSIASTDLGFVFVDSLLYIVNVDGSGLEQINATLENVFAPAWQPRTALVSSPTVDTTEAVPLATPTNPTIFLSRAVDLYSSPSRFAAIFKTPKFVNVASLPVQGISVDGMFYLVEFSGYKGWILADGAVEFAGDVSLVPVVDEKGVELVTTPTVDEAAREPRLIFTNGYYIAAVNLNGGEAQPLSDSGSLVPMSPHASADGTRILYTRGGGSNLQYFIANRDGSNPIVVGKCDAATSVRCTTAVWGLEDTT